MRAFAILVALTVGCRSSTESPLRVAAASDLTLAFTELNTSFHEASGRTVTLNFGSTGVLAKQLEQGAPFDVFAAADVATVDALIARGTCIASTRRVFARGRVVVATAPGIELPTSLQGLTDERFKRIALANVEHAPYGRAAKAALEKSRLFEVLEPRIVYGESVSHALQLVRTGNAEAGLVAHALITDGPMLMVDGAIDQAAVVCGTDPARIAAATKVLEAISASGTVLSKYGFETP